ncbi:MAG: tetratricopeptide repeat-containing sensor histidine kinase [Flavobacteriales bacterium]
MKIKTYINKILIGSIFFFHGLYYAQEIENKQIDSILQSIEEIPNDFEKIKLLTSTAGKKRYTKATYPLITKALDIANDKQQEIFYAHTFYSLGNYYYYQSNTDSSLYYLKKAQNNLKNNKEEPFLKSQILATQSGNYDRMGKFIKAISLQIKAKEILDKIDTLSLEDKLKHKLKGQKLVLNNTLANLYSKTEDYNKALIYYDKAFKNALQLKSIGNASIILGNKGDLLIKTKKIKQAIKTLLQSKKMKQEAKLPKRFIATAHLNLASAYSELNEYEKALKYFDSANFIYINTNEIDGLMRVATHRGILYNKNNQAQKALEDCTKGKKLAKKINDAELIYLSCECLYQANKKLKKYNEALKNYEQYTAIKDSLFNEKNIRKITQVGMQYEYDKLKTEKNLKIEKEKRKKNTILVGLIVSGLLLISLFIFFKKRIKYQKTITTQKETLQKQKITQLQQKNKLTALNSMIEGQEAERLRIAKDLHDSLGGLLSSIKTHFNILKTEHNEINKSNIANKTNLLIDEACIEVRRISHNMIPQAIHISGLTGAIEDLGERLNKAGYYTSIEIKDIPSNIDETKKTVIYRLIQEIISNIKKHAKAKNILIQLITYKNVLTLLIEDDGIGFNYQEAIKKDGLGLKSINSRVEFLDGKIDWDSKIGNGTTIIIKIPL